MKSLLVFIIMLTSHLSLAQEQVCVWQGDGYTFSTNSYTWGGGEFDSLDECGDVVRATLIFFDFGQGNSKGDLRFKAKDGSLGFCRFIPMQFPFSPASHEFTEMMNRASQYQSSPAEVSLFRNYLDENLALDCQ